MPLQSGCVCSGQKPGDLDVTHSSRPDLLTLLEHRYFERLDAIAAEDFVPTEEDVVLCRMRTIGIVSTKVMIHNNIFNIYDVGGQRNERRKWIHCFDEVTAVIFVAALSEYDQVC